MQIIRHLPLVVLLLWGTPSWSFESSPGNDIPDGGRQTVEAVDTLTPETKGVNSQETSAAESLNRLADIPVPEVFQKAAPEGLADLRTIERHVQELVRRVQPFTVGIEIGRSHGSGVLVSEDGFVLTAGHVIMKPGTRCRIILNDGKRVRATALGVDRLTDAGLVLIDDPDFKDHKWEHASFGNRSEIAPGDWCLGLGHPGGFQKDRLPVVRLGRVIAAGKALLKSDCELVGGDSGGPLFNMSGQVIGIHSHIQESTDANFHVSIGVFKDEWERLEEGEFIEGHSGAMLGVSGTKVDQGLKVTKVYEDHGAALAGVKEGDIIVTFQSRRVVDLDQLTELVGQVAVGKKIQLELLRQGKPIKLEVTLGARVE
ncbi:MAG: trypsin-like peptidase domain-containing protein [Planctomycetaceae bacterium]